MSKQNRFYNVLGVYTFKIITLLIDCFKDRTARNCLCRGLLFARDVVLVVLIAGFLMKNLLESFQTSWLVWLIFKLYLKTASRFSHTTYHVSLLKFTTLTAGRFEG